MARAPGLTHWIPLPYGAFREFLRDSLGFQLRARERFGDVFRYQIGPLQVHFLYHPDDVRHVLHDHQKNYPRGWHYRLLRRLLGNNLVVSEGDFWRRQRRLAQPAFHRQRLAGFAEVMVDATCQMLARWEELLTTDGIVDVDAETSRLALAIAGRTLFSRDVSHAADAVGSAFGTLSRHLELRFNVPLTTPPLWLPTAGNRRVQQALRTLNQLVLEMIQARRREGHDRGDLLSMLMLARDEETGAAMTDAELRSEVLTFLMAGPRRTIFPTCLPRAWCWRKRCACIPLSGPSPGRQRGTTRLAATTSRRARRCYCLRSSRIATPISGNNRRRSTPIDSLPSAWRSAPGTPISHFWEVLISASAASSRCWKCAWS